MLDILHNFTMVLHYVQVSSKEQNTTPEAFRDLALEILGEGEDKDQSTCSISDELTNAVEKSSALSSKTPKSTWSDDFVSSILHSLCNISKENNCRI